MSQVSVIILNYNTFELTCSCIKSILEKTKEIDYEIILVDNASSQCNPLNFVSLFPDIILIESKKNLGFAGGNNLGIQKAKNRHILLLNSDTLLLNDAISIAFKNFVHESNLAVVAVKILLDNNKVQYSCDTFPSVWKTIFQKTRLHKIFPKKLRGKIFLGYNFNYNELIYPDYVHGTFMMIDREKISRKDKLLNNKYFMYAEDLLWCWEFRQNGYEILFDPKGLIFHFWKGSLEESLDVVKKWNNDNYKDFLNSYASSRLQLFLLKYLC